MQILGPIQGGGLKYPPPPPSYGPVLPFLVYVYTTQSLRAYWCWQNSFLQECGRNDL